MTNNNNNDGMNGGFDDDSLDEFDTEFNDAEFDDAGLDDSEFTDLADDGEYADDDFESGDWEDAEPAAKGRKEKSLYQTGEKKSLSFNTIVIIGAVVLGGGVMAYTIMSKTAEMKAGQKTFFQSVLNIGGVMDGTLFGEKEPEPTQEEQAIQAVQNANQGFLSNPDQVLPENTNIQEDGNPPQPVPMSPSELAGDMVEEPLTPMPDGVNVMPRGPDESAPVDNGIAAVEPAPEAAPIVPVEAGPSAEDILKQAMANREQKAQEKKAATETVKPAEEKEPVAAPIFAEPAPVVAPQPVPSVDPAVVAAATKAAEKNTKAVETLEGKIDTLLKRMEQIESDLGTVRESRQGNSQDLENQIASLKKEIVAIKERPVAVPAKEKAASRPVEDDEDDVAQVPVSEKPKPAAKKKKVAAKAAPVDSYASAPAPKAKSVNTGRWELRAAQPGRAWVSKPGERDMQGVEVGQSLPGIGRITAITYQNGRWTVSGTQGQIQQ